MNEKVFLLMFDAKVKTYVQRKNYLKFVKALKSFGYAMLQKSVYIRFSDTSADYSIEKKRLENIIPSTIEVRILKLPYALFNQMSNINCLPIKFYAKEEIICV